MMIKVVFTSDEDGVGGATSDLSDGDIIGTEARHHVELLLS